MAVHLPLSEEAQAESRFLILSVNNILAPKDGKPITTPTQDMVLGSYYLTLEVEGAKGEGRVFSSYDELVMAYSDDQVHLHAKVKVMMRKNKRDRGKLVESTVGRFIFNEHIPQDLGYVDRTKDEYGLEVDKLVSKKTLGDIIDRTFRKHGNTKTAQVLDKIKEMGFHYSTIGAITIGVSDIDVPDAKENLIKEAERKVIDYEKKYRRGILTDEERYENVIKIWNKTTEDVTEELMDNLDELNNLFIMSKSGARGSRNQIKQLAGMRGLMANAVGQTVEIPVKSNFREGLSVLEFFISTTGARKGLADTALRTADSGYLTRRLADVSQDVIVKEEDCGTKEGLEVEAFIEDKEEIENLYDRIVGRYSVEDIENPDTGQIIVEKGAMILEEQAEEIVNSGIKKVKIRSVLTCKTENGVCTKCYGRNLATGKLVNVGEAIGFIAAQSIGEPGTQLTMRTFHTGGIAAAADITQGLPRVEELFEARKPKGQAIISEISGKTKIKETAKKREVTITNEEDKKSKTYTIPYGAKILLEDGQIIDKGDKITSGSVNPHDIYKIKGIQALQLYILQEVQRVYKMQGVDINDKHISVVIRQMLSKVKIKNPGDTELLPGTLVSYDEFIKVNEEAEAKGIEQAKGDRVLLGITKASLATESFLSSASFQETTRVLTDAAIKGKTDYLQGLKENVIIGKLIPAGTGLKKYEKVMIRKEIPETDLEKLKDKFKEDSEE
jgi:DNA-directed RNA polymerase subunit beta'